MLTVYSLSQCGVINKKKKKKCLAKSGEIMDEIKVEYILFM